MSNGPSGWLGAAGSILGVVSTVIGVWVALNTQQLKATSEAQKLRIDAQDVQLRVSADQRATMSAQRDYVLKVYDKVILAVETTDKRKQQVALALVESLADPALQEKLARVFTSAPTVEDQSTRDRAHEIQRTAAVAVAAQAGNSKGWDYDIFWCQERSANEETAKKVLGAIPSGDPAHGRLRLRSWSASQNAQSGYGVKGYEIRAEAPERSQAELLKRVIDPMSPQPFEIKPTSMRTAWHISVWVCPAG